MKVLIVSDTHRHNENYIKVIERERVSPIDMIIHCGDNEGSDDIIDDDANCTIKMVLGNNDFFSELPRELEFHIGKYSVWLTHGHNYYVSMGNETIKKEAKARGVNIVMYGHTHKPLVEEDEDIIAINPGSLTYPRQEGKRPSYIIMELDENGKASFKINYL